MRADELKYSKDHMWVAVEKDEAILGISEHAQRELGEVVFLDLPEVGKKLAAGDVTGSIESVKTTNDVFTPLSGEIVQINTAARDDPGEVNSDPLGRGWLYRIRLSAPDEVKALMDFAAYQAFVQAAG